jgi:hypothetical protein
MTTGYLFKKLRIIWHYPILMQGAKIEIWKDPYIPPRNSKTKFFKLQCQKSEPKREKSASRWSCAPAVLYFPETLFFGAGTHFF